MEQLFKQLNLVTDWKTPTSNINPIMHSYRSSDLYLIKWGKIRNIWSDSSNFSKSIKFLSQIYLFEFDVEVFKINFNEIN
jgi:hypothetical protein